MYIYKDMKILERLRIWRQWNAFYKECQDEFFNDIMRLATSTNAVIIDRIQLQRLNAEYQPFGIYKEATQKSKVRKGRDTAGFPNINFTDSGDMLRNVHPQVQISGHKATISFSPTLAAEIEKLQHNEKRFGEILVASDKEIEALKNDYLNILNERARKYNLL